MIKVNKKAIVSVILVIITLAMCVVPVFATDPIGGVSINPDTGSVDSSITTKGNKILGYIQVVGTIIAVGMLMFLGIKYMTASASEKADLKKSLIPYIVGAVILLMASNLVKIIYDVAIGF